jgi:cysteine-rich repeat protein
MRKFVLATTLYASLLAVAAASPADAATLLLDFESFADGQVLQPGALGNGITMQLNPHDDDDVPVVFNSSCVHSQCAPGFDDDLKTPGHGHGNTVALNNILALEEEDDDRRSPGGSHSRDDEEDTWVFIFDPPLKVLGLTVINVGHGDSGSRIELRGPGQQLQLIPLALLGENSVQRVNVVDPFLATSMVLVLDDDAAIDNLFVTDGCGDGILDAGEQCDDGNADDGDCCSENCEIQNSGLACDDGDPCTPADSCDSTGSCIPAGNTCGDGVVDAACGETCDDGNSNAGDCCSSDCSAGAAGTICDDDGSPCTDEACDGLGACLHPPNTAACDDSNACTVGDTCAGGSCGPGPALDCDDGNPCTDDQCLPASGCASATNAATCDNGNPGDDPDQCEDGVCTGQGGCQGNNANCDDGNACTIDLCLPTGTCDHSNTAGGCEDGNACTSNDSCSGGICQPGPPTDCDDGNICTDDNCDQNSGCSATPNSSPCDDGLFCNGSDTCAAGSCQHSGDPCAAGDQCSDQCNETAADCLSPAGSFCDGGDACTPADTCDGDGLCLAGGTTCGDDIVQGECAEECDPPDGSACDLDCSLFPFCGDGTVDPDEFCDDGNDQADDGCFDCSLESGELFCFEGSSASPSRRAKEIVFQSAADYTANNADGNTEIFLLSRKEYGKRIRLGDEPSVALSTAITQLTDTTSLVFGVDNYNENPALNGSGRFVAFSSNSDLIGSNPDGNTEIFHLDRRRSRLLQITQSVGATNLHPNMRASKARLLLFDSDGELVNSCVGGDNDRNSCGSDADCPGLVCDDPARCPNAPARCGNPEGNPEIFMWKRELVGPSTPSPTPELQQLTAADSGISVVGHSVNFNSAAIAFSSTADLLATNPPGTAGERALYRIGRKATQLVQVTSPSPSGFFSESPSQSRKRFIAFASDADLVAGSNGDGNTEIFLWDANLPSSPYTQVTNTTGCTNAMPSVGAKARYIAFQSTCDLLGNGSNSGQAIFLYDRDKDGFASGIVLKGPGGYDSSLPQVSRIVRVIVFEADPGGTAPQQVCVFNVRKGAFEGSTVPAKP